MTRGASRTEIYLVDDDEESEINPLLEFCCEKLTGSCLLSCCVLGALGCVFVLASIAVPYAVNLFIVWVAFWFVHKGWTVFQLFLFAFILTIVEMMALLCFRIYSHVGKKREARKKGQRDEEALDGIPYT